MRLLGLKEIKHSCSNYEAVMDSSRRSYSDFFADCSNMWKSGMNQSNCLMPSTS